MFGKPRSPALLSLDLQLHDSELAADLRAYVGLDRGGPLNQAVAALADQVRPAGVISTPANFEIVFRLEELHERPLHQPVLQAVRRCIVFRERIDSRVIHAGGHVEWADEILNLVGR